MDQIKVWYLINFFVPFVPLCEANNLIVMLSLRLRSTSNFVCSNFRTTTSCWFYPLGLFFYLSARSTYRTFTVFSYSFIFFKLTNVIFFFQRVCPSSRPSVSNNLYKCFWMRSFVHRFTAVYFVYGRWTRGHEYSWRLENAIHQRACLRSLCGISYIISWRLTTAWESLSSINSQLVNANAGKIYEHFIRKLPTVKG